MCVYVPGREVEASLDRPRRFPGKDKGPCMLACIREGKSERCRESERGRDREPQPARDREMERRTD